MTNLCFLSGIVKDEIDLKFIYNAETKSLSEKHTTIVFIDLEIEKKQIVKCYAYDEIADYIYSNIGKNDFIMVCGQLGKRYIQIIQIEK